jgi:hypothetical protein
MKLYTVSATLIGEGDAITTISATSLGGMYWKFDRTFIGAASARTVTENLSSKQLLSRLKLLSFDASITNKTAVMFNTVLIDPEVGRTIHKNDEVKIVVLADDAHGNDINIELWQNKATININSAVAGKEEITVIGNNAEELFEALGKIC